MGAHAEFYGRPSLLLGPSRASDRQIVAPKQMFEVTAYQSYLGEFRAQW